MIWIGMTSYPALFIGLWVAVQKRIITVIVKRVRPVAFSYGVEKEKTKITLSGDHGDFVKIV